MTEEIERDENAYVYENSDQHQLEQHQNEIELNNKNEDDLNLREKLICSFNDLFISINSLN